MKSRESDPLVLVVDDDDGMRAYIRQCLRPLTRHVIEATDGLAALEAARRAAGEGLALVVADVVMPGIDGALLCEALRAEPATRDLPVLLVTGSARRPERLSAAVLRKPFNSTTLRAQVEQLLQGDEGGR